MQHTGINSFMPNFRCRQYVILLAFLWIIGLLLGVYFGHLTADQSIPHFRNAAGQQISVTGLVIVQLLPLLLIALCVLTSRPVFVLFVLLADAVGCGFNLCGISTVFQSASWLVYLLLCFSDTATSVLLLWLSIRQFSGHRCFFKKDMVKCLIISLFIGIFDYFSISPFLVSLMNS